MKSHLIIASFVVLGAGWLAIPAAIACVPLELYRAGMLGGLLASVDLWVAASLLFAVSWIHDRGAARLAMWLGSGAGATGAFAALVVAAWAAWAGFQAYLDAKPVWAIGWGC